MAEGNGVHAAPRGAIARYPTGFRRLTPGLLKVDRTANDFAGLPDRGSRHLRAKSDAKQVFDIMNIIRMILGYLIDFAWFFVFGSGCRSPGGQGAI